MAIVPNLRVLQPLLVVLPESLYAPGALVSVPEVIPPGTLNARGHIVPVSVAHCLQGEELGRTK